MIVRMKHLRAAGYCNREPRVWFKQRGWSWQEFLDHGIDAEKLIATGDPIALRVVEMARQSDGE